jgi:hypothetical protein
VSALSRPPGRLRRLSETSPPATCRKWLALAFALTAFAVMLAAMAWPLQKRTKHDEIRHWLMRIADVVERWPTMRHDDIETVMVVTTPAGAVAVMVNTDIRTAEVRRAVVAGLPNVLSEDWAEAAQQVREAAARLVAPSTT